MQKTGLPQSFIAILWMIGGILMISMGSALVRLASGSFAVSQMVLLRMLMIMILVIVFCTFVQKQSFWRTGRLGLHIVRGVVGVMAISGYFLSLYLLPLADVSALTLTDTLFVAVLSALFLRERNDYRYWMMVILGFIGVILVTRPGASIFNVASLGAVLVGFLFAVILLLIGYMAKTETFGSTSFYFALISVLVTLALVPWQWWTPDSYVVRNGLIGWKNPSLTEWLLVFGMAICGAVGNLCVTHAFRLGRASLVAPFGYLDLPFSAFLGFLLLHENIDVFLILGGGAIIFSGIGLIYLEHRQQVRKKQEINKG